MGFVYHLCMDLANIHEYNTMKRSLCKVSQRHHCVARSKTNIKKHCKKNTKETNKFVDSRQHRS